MPPRERKSQPCALPMTAPSGEAQPLTSASRYTLVHCTCFALSPAKTMGLPRTSKYSYSQKRKVVRHQQNKQMSEIQCFKVIFKEKNWKWIWNQIIESLSVLFGAFCNFPLVYSLNGMFIYIYTGSIGLIYSIYLLQVFFLVPIRTLFLKVQPVIRETYSLGIASCWSKLSRALWFMCETAQIWNDKTATSLLSHNRLLGWNSKLHLNISKKWLQYVPNPDTRLTFSAASSQPSGCSAHTSGRPSYLRSVLTAILGIIAGVSNWATISKS